MSSDCKIDAQLYNHLMTCAIESIETVSAVQESTMPNAKHHDKMDLARLLNCRIERN
jgi:hypothetical protein